MNPGIFLALLGTLILTPDALFMRLSGLSGGEMVAWRATQGGSIFFLIGLLPFIWPRSEVKPKIWRKSFLALILVQMANVFCFAYGIFLAPVAIHETHTGLNLGKEFLNDRPRAGIGF